MSPTLLPLTDLPGRGDILFCKWPTQRVGNYARPVLVSHAVRLIHASGVPVGAVWVFYGTSQFPAQLDLRNTIVIQDGEIARCGLTQRTRFDISRRHQILWSDEYFVAPAAYKRLGAPYIGCVSDEALAQLDQKYPMLQS